MEDILASIRTLIADEPGETEPLAAGATLVATDSASSDPMAPLLGEGSEQALGVASQADVASLVDGAPSAVGDVQLTVADIEDMDLVKSLMADLTDIGAEPDGAVAEQADSLSIEASPTPSSVWSDDDLSIPEMDMSSDGASSLSGGEETDLTDLLDDILGQSIQDEAALVVEAPVERSAAGRSSLLSAIAAQADADAQALSDSADAALRGPVPELVSEPGSTAVTETVSAQTVSLDTVQVEDAEVAVDLAELDMSDDVSIPDLPLAADTFVEDTTLSVADTDLDAIIGAAATVEAEAPHNMTQALEEEVMARNAKLEESPVDVSNNGAGSAFAELNRLVEEKSVFAERGPRIGDLVQEALQPMLKEWLDANIKGIVERAVQKEIKRISSGD